MITRGGPRLSHLYFANDLIMFAKVSVEQVQVIKRALEIFCQSSGHKINFGKSCVFFLKNIHHTKMLN